MKYSDFKKLVIENMPKNPNPGLWHKKGEPRSHILGNPSTMEEKVELINTYSILPNIPPIDCKSIHLHQYAHHLNSSQIMCYNFFRPLIESFNGKMYTPKTSLLNLIKEEIDKDIISNDTECNFEYIDNSNENTNFDFYIRSGKTEIFCEIKYTEEKFSKKSSAKNPHVRFISVYKPMIELSKDIFIDGTISEEDFNKKYYQLARNAIRATTSDKHVFFIYPQKHDGLKKQFKEFSDNCLTAEGKKRVKSLTWEKLVQDAESLNLDYKHFKERYLDFINK